MCDFVIALMKKFLFVKIWKINGIIKIQYFQVARVVNSKLAFTDWSLL